MIPIPQVMSFITHLMKTDRWQICTYWSREYKLQSTCIREDKPNPSVTTFHVELARYAKRCFQAGDPHGIQRMNDIYGSHVND